MKGNSIRFYILLGVVFAAFTGIVFAVPVFHRNSVFWISYLFSTFAILIQLYIQPRALDHGRTIRSKVYGLPIAKMGVIYLLAQLLFSIIFMLCSSFIPVWVVIVLSLLLFVAAVVGFIIVDTARSEVERQDIKLEESVKTMRTFRVGMEGTVERAKGTALEKSVLELSEKFRFSDPVSSEDLTEIEEKLKGLCDQLSEAVTEHREEEAAELIKETELVLNERNRLCKISKKH